MGAVAGPVGMAVGVAFFSFFIGTALFDVIWFTQAGVTHLVSGMRTKSLGPQPMVLGMTDEVSCFPHDLSVLLCPLFERSSYGFVWEVHEELIDVNIVSPDCIGLCKQLRRQPRSVSCTLRPSCECEWNECVCMDSIFYLVVVPTIRLRVTS